MRCVLASEDLGTECAAGWAIAVYKADGESTAGCAFGGLHAPRPCGGCQLGS
jgi:hypothetical protein